MLAVAARRGRTRAPGPTIGARPSSSKPATARRTAPRGSAGHGASRRPTGCDVGDAARDAGLPRQQRQRGEVGPGDAGRGSRSSPPTHRRVAQVGAHDRRAEREAVVGDAVELDDRHVLAARDAVQVGVDHAHGGSRGGDVSEPFTASFSNTLRPLSSRDRRRAAVEPVAALPRPCQGSDNVPLRVAIVRSPRARPGTRPRSASNSRIAAALAAAPLRRPVAARAPQVVVQPARAAAARRGAPTPTTISAVDSGWNCTARCGPSGTPGRRPGCGRAPRRRAAW